MNLPYSSFLLHRLSLLQLFLASKYLKTYLFRPGLFSSNLSSCRGGIIRLTLSDHFVSFHLRWFLVTYSISILLVMLVTQPWPRLWLFKFAVLLILWHQLVLIKIFFFSRWFNARVLDRTKSDCLKIIILLQQIDWND